MAMRYNLVSVLKLRNAQVFEVAVCSWRLLITEAKSSQWTEYLAKTLLKRIADKSLLGERLLAEEVSQFTNNDYGVCRHIVECWAKSEFTPENPEPYANFNTQHGCKTLPSVAGSKRTSYRKNTLWTLCSNDQKETKPIAKCHEK
ncbi:hypothetical protein N7530_011196 [Penicillium desertorum]|uniref:Uncharacterized protein n=1 Tax=Penicillium desertorum TaxID=1303715 RepID=A0A9W9WGS1_9EURO|nr:hypothetical protein N7530_011196 [Penicillium desertorum]